MTFKRLLMPLLVLGVSITMGSMVFAQSTVTCTFLNAAGDVTAGAAGSGALAVNAVTVPGPTGHATATGHTEPVMAGAGGNGSNVITTNVPAGGLLRIDCTNTGAATTTTVPGVVVLTITFTNNNGITNTQSFPTPATGIRVVNGTGAFTAAGATTASVAGANVGISSVSNSGASIVIGLGTNGGASTSSSPAVNPNTGVAFPAGTPAAPSHSTFDLMGVLVSTNGKTGEVDATMISTGGINVGGTGIAQVITTVSPGLIDPSVPISGLPAAVTALGTAGNPVTGGAAVLNSAGTAIKGNFTIKIAENYPELFKSATQFNGGGTFPASTASSVLVNVVFKNVPVGLSIAGCSAVLTDSTGATGGTVTGSPQVSTTNLSAAANVLTVTFTANTTLTTSTVLWVTCTNVSATVGTVLSAPVTAQAELAPLGTALPGAFSTAGTTLSNGQTPRYQDTLQPTTALTVIVFPPSSTNMLLTFATVGAGYNTGIGIANTTADPFGLGAGATPVNGTITFNMFPNGGAVKTYTTTTGSPGQGLSTGGVLNSGSIYLVNLSDLLTAAGAGTTFNGYMFITANFTNAHGAATVYLTSTGAAALSSPLLVLPAISTAQPRNAVDGGTPDGGAGLGQ